MEYIEDTRLFSAVKFASKMIAEGKDPRVAISIAANYYAVDSHDVAHYVGKNANEKKQLKNKKK